MTVARHVSPSTSHPLSPVGNEGFYLHLEETENPVTNTVLSVTLFSLREGAKMTFYDDIYPFYPLQRTSFIFSGRLLTIILVFLVLAVSLLLILPGIRGKSVSASDDLLLTAVLSQNLRVLYKLL